ncbi:MAG TPA: hypothetical protein PLU36_07565 [Chitinophagaceae bacterium]|nr:hypothetical protein [Chitinophagaceae bacterium]HMZ46645.1 hypothetical protein [Chitinophagaceae bacterium]HNE92921.1 hypothetical protein [Chitinophagaceae bacterium]HNF29423.1 hypothetical protein [Chitinophagaceae bacterium]HNJ57396.1 hypothetical protein [Chitinophagaceae bacterium]
MKDSVTVKPFSSKEIIISLTPTSNIIYVEEEKPKSISIFSMDGKEQTEKFVMN